MPTLNACDFYAPPENVEQFYRDLYAQGIRWVQRYLWDGAKGVTAREMAAAAAAGVRIAYGYEHDAGSWRGGAATGAQHRADATAIASKLGVPKGTPIFYAVDEDAHGLGMMSTALAYVRAADDPDYPASAYGQYDLAEALRKPMFQTYAWPPRDSVGNYRYGAVSKYAALFQWHNGQHLAGCEVDFCEVIDPSALGPHPTPGSTDLLEWIMTLPGAPKGLTYPQLVHDIAEAVWTIDGVIPNPLADPASQKRNPFWWPATFIQKIYQHQHGIEGQ